MSRCGTCGRMHGDERNRAIAECPQCATGLFRQQAPDFAGAEYDHAVDHARLTDQLTRIKTLMFDRRWRTLAEIAKATRTPEASVSAQLRHLRKPRFGGYTVDRRRRSGAGLWEYHVDPSSVGSVVEEPVQ
jgi:hypothetical protein